MFALRALAMLAAAWGAANLSSAASQAYRGVDLFTLTDPAGFHLEVDVSQLHANGGQVAGFASSSSTAFLRHATLWNGSGAGIDLHPDFGGAFRQSLVAFTDGAQQVGAGLTSAGAENALLWNGTADSAINLQPTNLPHFAASRATGTDGGQQVGVGVTEAFVEHAMLWSGSANSAVDLHPTTLGGFISSAAVGIQGGREVGFGLTTSSAQHALTWTGAASSAVDLHPTSLLNIVGSAANATHGHQQVGSGTTDASRENALLWSGTADSAVNLHPVQWEAIVQSRGLATNGMQQAGVGFEASGLSHALVWSGTAASAIDLQLALPPPLVASSATSIDMQGNLYGVARDAGGGIHAVKWTPILPGDFDGDAVVDETDLSAWRAGFGTAAAAEVNEGDANGDGAVDGADLLIWQRNLGGTPRKAVLAAGAVPEPTAGALAIAAALALLASGRRVASRTYSAPREIC